MNLERTKQTASVVPPEHSLISAAPVTTNNPQALQEVVTAPPNLPPATRLIYPGLQQAANLAGNGVITEERHLSTDFAKNSRNNSSSIPNNGRSDSNFRKSLSQSIRSISADLNIATRYKEEGGGQHSEIEVTQGPLPSQIQINPAELPESCLKSACEDIPMLIVPLVVVALGVGLGYLVNVVDVVLIAFGVQWVVYIPSAIMQSEKFFDLTGSLTYITTVIYSLASTKDHSLRKIVNSVLVLVWAARLGTFLFHRIMKDGKDSRFKEIKTRPLRFLSVWTIQGLWVFITALPVYALNTADAKSDPSLGWRDVLGWSLWLLGFALESIADLQKSAFRNKPENKGKFIQSGLWRYSRHPNYFGEIVLWCGMFLTCSMVFKNLQWIASISPAFVTLLLLFVSGVPLLEKAADERWGSQEEYKRYKSSTSVLIPWFKSSPKKSS